MPSKSSNPKDNDQKPAVNQDSAMRQQGGSSSASASGGGADLTDIIRKLSDAGGVPIKMSFTPLDKIDTGERLTNELPVTVAFPPCAEELLALIQTTDILFRDKDDVVRFFDEYFVFGEQHVVIPPERGDVSTVIDSALLGCSSYSTNTGRGRIYARWPSECCICTPCVTLDGNRNALESDQANGPDGDVHIRRLFAGDLLWLFYMGDRLGVLQILGAILDAYASNGRLPISNGAVDPGVRDDVTAVILEVMVRQTKMGMSSTVRDRGGSYQTVLGWAPEIARRLKLDTQINTGFNTLFHKFIYNALEFYKDKRLAVAIQGSASGSAPPSVATLTTISNTLDVLKKRFEAFDYGRNYYNALSGIVWTIAAMTVIRELRTTLGIPPAYNDPHEYIPAAYDLLVLKRPVTSGDTNRYIVHKECARNGRDILLDIEVIDFTRTEVGGELEQWLTQIEAKVEAYRTAYRTLTGVDLGASATPVVEQQV